MGLLLCCSTELLTRFCPNTLTAQHLPSAAICNAGKCDRSLHSIALQILQVCSITRRCSRGTGVQTLPAGAQPVQHFTLCVRLHFVQCKLHTSCTNSMHNQCTGRARTSCARIMFAKCKLLLNLRCFGQSYLLCRTCQDSL